MARTSSSSTTSAGPASNETSTSCRRTHGNRLHTVFADVRDTTAVDDTVRNAKAVFHFAAQVAVTSSLIDPMQDFAINAQGTLTILDALRRLSPETPLIFASTNKVYGSLSDLAVEQFQGRYLPVDQTAARLRRGREPAARFLHALRLFERGGRPIRAGLCEVVWAEDGGAAHELHLRAASVRHRGSGMGSTLPDPRAAWRADHHLWRRPTGARHPACQRRRRGLSRRAWSD